MARTGAEVPLNCSDLWARKRRMVRAQLRDTRVLASLVTIQRLIAYEREG